MAGALTWSGTTTAALLRGLGGALSALALVACGGGESSSTWVACGESQGFVLTCQNSCPTSANQAFTCKLVPASGSSSTSSGGSVSTGTDGPYDAGLSPLCTGDASVCAAGCVDLATDPNNCGGCGAVCGSGNGCIAGKCVPADQALLGYRPIDAEYSRPLDRAVLVSDTPATLHLLDARANSDAKIALPKTPTSVSVSPDGLHAAVGHDGYVSYVDLQAQTVVGTYAVSAPVGDVVLGGNGYAYAFPSSDQWVSLHVVDLTAGMDLTSGNTWQIYAGSVGALSPDGTTLFVADRGLSPSSLYAYSLASPNQPSQTSMLFGDTYPVCGSLWVSEKGDRIYTGCGSVFHASDLSYAGSLTGLSTVVSADDSSADGTVAALGLGSQANSYGPTGTAGGTSLLLYGGAYLSPMGSKTLPPLAAPGGAGASDGLFVFYDKAGTSIVTILHASDPVSQADVYGVAVF